jgi:hypothetical protein
MICQAIFRRRRHQPRRPPLARIRIHSGSSAQAWRLEELVRQTGHRYRLLARTCLADRYTPSDRLLDTGMEVSQHEGVVRSQPIGSAGVECPTKAKMKIVRQRTLVASQLYSGRKVIHHHLRSVKRLRKAATRKTQAKRTIIAICVTICSRSCRSTISLPKYAY